jgi:phosphate transport system ATP-binding protein
MSIYENVAIGPKLRGLSDEEKLQTIVEGSLKEASLWDEVKNELESPGTNLSGGQQQRLCIARALALKPEVLLMDEPTSALDPIAAQRIENLLRQLSEEYTIIIVTHNIQQAARISGMSAFFYMGELIEYGDTRTLFERPEKELTEKYITGRFS